VSGDAWSERVVRVLAPNPSPMTLEGTNTFVVAEPGAGGVVVIDPGPADDGHAGRVMDACAGRRVELVLLTHGHIDHAEGAAAFAVAAGASLAAADPALASAGAPDLEAGTTIEAGGLRLDCVPTPGHAADHVVFVLAAERAAFSGDHVLGRGSTVVAWPDGDMRAYLDSLQALRGHEPALARLYPGHGPLVDDAPAKLAEYVAHRLERERQVLAALAAGDRTPAQVVARVYADVPVVLHPAAERSVRAHLDKLVADGLVGTDGGEAFTIA
jgi:glyoxylase-like metal-dependent hydrolase (beta-lactamase superfamily II)